MRRVSATLAAALISAAVLLVSPLGAAPPGRTTSPQDRADRVLAQVNALDIEFGKVVDSWNGARIQLAASERQLRGSRRRRALSPSGSAS